MNETQAKEKIQPAQEEEAKQPTPEETTAPTEHKLILTGLVRNRLFYIGPSAVRLAGEPYFSGKYSFVTIPLAYQIGFDREASDSEEVSQQEMQSECVALSQYINDNISDIIRLREESDRLSEELRMAMAKLRAA